MDNIGKKIMLARKSRDLTQIELAEKLNKSKSTISNWEIEGEKLSIEKLQKIAEALDVDVSFLTGVKEEKILTTQQQLGSVLNKSIIYSKFSYKFSWFKNILLFSFVALSVSSVLIESYSFFVFSLIPIAVYMVFFIISEIINVENSGPTIYYSDTSALVFKQEKNIKRFVIGEKGQETQ